MLQVPGTPQETPQPEKPTFRLLEAYQSSKAQEGQLDGAMKQVTKDSAAIPPERAARVLKMAFRTGVDRDVINDNLDELEAEASAAGFDPAAFRRSSPKMAQWLHTSKFHRAVGREDIEKLGDIERMFVRKDDQTRPLSDAEVQAQAERAAERRAAANQAAIEQNRKANEQLAAVGAPASPGAMVGIEDFPDHATAKKAFLEREIKQRQANERFIMETDKVGFLESVGRRATENPAFLAPFLGSVVDAAKQIELYMAAKAVGENKATEDQADLVLTYGRLAAAAERRGTSVFGKTAEILAGLPAVAGEFALTGGSYRTTKVVVERTLRQATERAISGLLGKAIAAIPAAAVQTGAMSLPRIAGGTAQRMLPGISVKPDQEGQLRPVLDPTTADNFGMALLKAVGTEYVQTLSERTGAGVEHLMGPLKKAIAARWIKAHPAEGVEGFLSKVKEATGWNGILGEMFEERAAEVMQAPIDGYHAPTVDQLKAELLGFGAFPAASMVINKALSRRPAVTQQDQDKALSDSQLIQAIGQAAKDLKIAQVSPEAMQDAIKVLAKGTPAENLWVDARRFAGALVDKKDEEGAPIDPKALAERMGVVPAAYDQAVERGGDLKLATEKFFTEVATSESMSFLQDELKTDPLHMSVAQTKELLTEQEKDAIASKAMESLNEDNLKKIASKVAKKERRQALEDLRSTDIIRQVQDAYGPRLFWQKAQGMGNAEELLTSGVPRSMIGDPRKAAEQGYSYAAPADVVAERFGMSTEELITAISEASRRRGEAETELESDEIPEHVLQAVLEKEFQDEVRRGIDEAETEKAAEKASERARHKKMIGESAKAFGQQVRQGMSASGFARDSSAYAIVAETLFRRAAERADLASVEKLFRQYNLSITRKEAPQPASAAVQSLEQGKDGGQPKLSALHNINEEGLAFAEELGGLAVPSIAVVPHGKAMTGFGDITLIGRKQLADPAEVPVFDADAYSPRFPDAEYKKVSTKEAQALVDEFRPFAAKFDDRGEIDSLWDNSVNTPDPERVIQDLLRSPAAGAWFLVSKGESIEPVTRVIEAGDLEAPFVAMSAFQEFVAKGEFPRVDHHDEAAWAEYSRAVAKAIDQYAEERGEKELREIWRDGYLDEEGKLHIGRTHQIERSIRRLGKTEVEHTETQKAVEAKLVGKEAEFKAWLEEKILPMFGEPKMTLGRKKVPYNLDNIVQAMTGRVRVQEKSMTFGEGAARAAASKRFKNLEQMRKAAKGIASESEINAARETAKKLMEKYRDQVVPFTTFMSPIRAGSIDTWEALDASMRAMAKWAKTGAKDAGAMRRALSSEGFKDVPQEAIDTALEAGQAWLKAPVPYFEAKPQRAVQLSEFAGAVIPANASEETRRILKESGVDVRTYEKEGDREKAVVDFTSELATKDENVLFQPAFHGSPHKFDRFTTAKIGSGEGHQAFGWGLYFAGNKEVAEYYRRKLSSDSANKEAATLQLPDRFGPPTKFFDAIDAIQRRRFSHPEVNSGVVFALDDVVTAMIRRGVSSKQALTDKINELKQKADDATLKANNHRAYREEAKAQREEIVAGQYEEIAKYLGRIPPDGIQAEKAGYVYQVDIPDDTDYLDWDELLSNQPKQFKEAIEQALAALPQDFIDQIESAYERGDDSVHTLDDWSGEDLYKALTKYASEGALPGDDPNVSNPKEAASKFLARLGFKGIKFLDQSSRRRGEGTNNYVVFDDKLIDLLSFEQPGEKEPRGQINLGPGRAMSIDLFRKADRSTALHELGHFYLEVLGDLVELPTASKDLQEDYKAILSWLGVERRSQIKREHHEKWARGFEAYLMEGKTPSAKLRGAFYRFKKWLTDLYRELVNLNVELSPEIRGVFDRMLATEDEITNARQEEEIIPLFEDAKASGMTDAEAIAHARAWKDLEQQAEESLGVRLMDEIRRQDEDWWDETLDQVRKEIGADVDTLPVYRALSVFKTGNLPDGTPAPFMGGGKVKLKRSDLVRLMPDETGTGVHPSIPKYVYAAKGGVSPDVAADWFGFSSGQELLEELAQAKPRNEFVEEAAQQRMKEEHGDAPSEEEIKRRAAEALHSDAYEEVLELEMQVLARQAAEAQRNVGGHVGLAPKVSVYKEQAVKAITRTKVGEIDPRQYQAAARRAARESVRLWKKGDHAGALRAKADQAMNAAYFRAASLAKENVNEALVEWRKLGKADDKLAKSRDVDLVNAARAILARINIGKKGRDASSYLKAIKDNDPDTYEALLAKVEDASGNDRAYTDLTYEEFLYVREAVDALWELSLRTHQFEVEGKKLDLKDVADQLIARLAALKKPGDRKEFDHAVGKAEERNLGLLGWKAALRRIESWVDLMDGGDPNGVFRRYIWTPISEAADKAREKKNELDRKLAELVATIEEDLTPDKIDAPELRYVFGENGSGLAEVLGALLHIGNPSNFQKLLRGHKWGEIDKETGLLDTSHWDAFMRRALDPKKGFLKKEHFDFLQGVWDLLDSEKSAVWKAHREMYGFYPDPVTAWPVVTPWGTYKGGYVPAIVDPLKATDAARREERNALERMDNSYAFPTTGKGATMKRSEAYAGPLKTDLRYLRSHLGWLARFTFLEPRVKDVGRLLWRKEFRDQLDQVDPVAGNDMLAPWLQRAATQVVETPMRGAGGRQATKFFSGLRKRTGLLLMAGNLVNAAQNITGLSLAALKVKPRHLAGALSRYVGDPAGTIEEIRAKSVFMRNRTDTETSAMMGDMNEMLLNPSKFEKVKDFADRHGYFFQRATQNVVDAVTWQGAYEQAIAEGADQKGAVRQADSAVRLTQGSAAAEDVSRAETGTAVVRAFTQFWGYFNMWANLLGTEFAKVGRDIGLKDGAGRALYIYTMGMLVPAVLAETIMVLSKGGLDDDDDDGYLDEMMATLWLGQFRSLAGMVPGGVLARYAVGDQDRVGASPAIAILEQAGRAPMSVYKAIADDGKSSRAVKDVLTLLGLLSGLPTGVVSRPAGYLTDVAEEKVEPSGPIDFLRGVATGKPGLK